MRLFSFPYIRFVRGHSTTDHPQTIEMTGGVQPLAIIPIGYCVSGQQLRVFGNLSALGGSGTINITTDSNDALQLTSTGAFDETITLTGSTDSVSILGVTNTTSTFTEFNVDLVEE